MTKIAQLRLAQFDAMDAIDALNDVLARFKAANGRMPQGWSEVVAARLLRGIPVDPAGVPFDIDTSAEVAHGRGALAAHADAAGFRRDATPMNSPSALALAGLLGLAVGSFLNVCIYRLPLRQSIAYPAIALSALRPRPELVRQHSGSELDRASRTLPPVRRAHLGPVSDRRARHRRARSSRSSGCRRPAR